jgi:hypothetical protein
MILCVAAAIVKSYALGMCQRRELGSFDALSGGHFESSESPPEWGRYWPAINEHLEEWGESSASIGRAQRQPGESIHDVIEHADNSMYTEKGLKRNPKR